MGSSNLADQAAVERSFVFALNGNRVELEHVDPTMTLLTYLRTQTELKGTKLGCGEGGCGACVVLVSRYQPDKKQVVESTINSCLALLCTLDRAAVTTIEGLGNSRDGLHAVQQRFAGFHASQCGFCTPGMCMSLYGGLKKHPEARAADLERSVAGNICRCTGYRPIADVCKSFASDVDLEDLGLNTYWSNPHQAGKHLLPAYEPQLDPQFPEFLVREIEEEAGEVQYVPKVILSSTSDDREWIRLSFVEEVFPALESYQAKKQQAKIVVGNTSSGVYKDSSATVFLDVSRIPELLVENRSELGLELGAGVRISRLVDVLEATAAEDGAEDVVCGALARHLKQVASVHVRNAGSVGGNLVMAQKLGFDSDIATLFLGLGVTVKLAVKQEQQLELSFDEFLDAPLGDAYLLRSVFIPFHKNAKPAIFQSFRASPRPFGNAVAYVNAAFLVQISSTADGPRIKSARLAFGAFGNNNARRAVQAEELLTGKVVTREVLLKAVELVKTSIVPKKGTRKASYRSSLATSFLFKFLEPLVGASADQHKGLHNGVSIKLNEAPPSLMSGGQILHQSARRGKLGQPVSKVLSQLQASGEAVYVDDIPAPRSCLYAAFVYSEKALAKIKAIHTDEAMKCPGAVCFVSYKDIPPSGKNVGVSSDLAVESLFATDTVECVGQPIGLMVSDTILNARSAAKRVEVEYDMASVSPPVTTIDDAVANNSFFEMPSHFKGLLGVSKIGDASQVLVNAQHKIEHAEVRTGSQYYFYMEAQTALVVPDEDNCVVVYSSCQGPDFVQSSVAACLGLPMHNVRVITRRVGGGFGGKNTKACIVASACALAASKVRRPVRLTLDRNTDMIMMSGRCMTKTVYTAGFNSDGKITGLQAQVFLQAGWNDEITGFMPIAVLSALKKFDWGSFDIDLKICKTNLPSRTSVRAPGDVQGSFIADAIIEHVAAILNLPSQKVMERNLHTLETAEAAYGAGLIGGVAGYTLPMVWQRLKEKANFDRRLKEAELFNESSLWKKRGLAWSQCSYAVTVLPKPARVSIFSDGSVVIEVGGVEIGQGLWTKVRQTAAFALSSLFDECDEGFDLERLRVVQLDTISLPHGGWTGGSTTSEGSCEAVRVACSKLVERLQPVKDRLKQDTNRTNWEAVVAAAKVGAVNLCEQAFYVSSPEAMMYINYGAAASEVEVDALTGEIKLLQTDIVYDCGKSLNPAVDLGQIEGAFAMGVGFFTCEEYVIDDATGRLVSDGTWTYKPPTIDTLPSRLNIELLNSSVHEHRILSSKASGEPPLLLASSVHGAIRHAIQSSRRDLSRFTGEQVPRFFQLDSPATIDKIRTACGLDNVEHYLKQAISIAL